MIAYYKSDMEDVRIRMRKKNSDRKKKNFTVSILSNTYIILQHILIVLVNVQRFK